MLYTELSGCANREHAFSEHYCTNISVQRTREHANTIECRIGEPANPRTQPNTVHNAEPSEHCEHRVHRTREHRESAFTEPGDPRSPNPRGELGTRIRNTCRHIISVKPAAFCFPWGTNPSSIHKPAPQPAPMAATHFPRLRSPLATETIQSEAPPGHSHYLAKALRARSAYVGRGHVLASAADHSQVCARAEPEPGLRTRAPSHPRPPTRPWPPGTRHLLLAEVPRDG